MQGWLGRPAPELAWCTGFVLARMQQHGEAKQWAERAIGLGCFSGSCKPLHAIVPAHLQLPVESSSWEGPWNVLVWANKGIGDKAGEAQAVWLHSQAKQARLNQGTQPLKVGTEDAW